MRDFIVQLRATCVGIKKNTNFRVTVLQVAIYMQFTLQNLMQLDCRFAVKLISGELVLCELLELQLGQSGYLSTCLFNQPSFVVCKIELYYSAHAHKQSN